MYNKNWETCRHYCTIQ